mmetsp:Transcript_2141/g.5020  ORF Transcript_2141/g.5020 Transcript_2141/m.5020 type:complete len:157 (+) Transcript_2141:93-563(+)
MPDNQVGDEVGEAAQSAVAAAAIGSDESPFRIGLKDIIAGSARGVAQVFVGHPLDTVKVRMQNGGFSSISQCLAQTARHEGLYGFYKGATSPLAGVVAYSATLFLVGAKTQPLCLILLISFASLFVSFRVSPRPTVNLATGCPGCGASRPTQQTDS